MILYGILGGRFTRWKRHVIHRDPEELAVHEVLELGSINLYMFHGGTNFGFMNGFQLEELDLPQVTSYDYGAFAQWTETADGEVLCHSKNDGDLISEYPQQEPLIKSVCQNKPCSGSKTSLFGESGQSGSVWDQPLSWKRWKSWGKPQVISIWDRPWVGYGREEKLRIIDGRDQYRFTWMINM